MREFFHPLGPAVLCALLGTILGPAGACGGEGPGERWDFPDSCDAGPVDEACFVSRRDPESGQVALALEIALRYMEGHPPAEEPWDWGPGTLMFALTELYRVTRDERLADYYRAWMDHHIAVGYPLSWSDHCPPALTALALYIQTQEPAYEAVVLDVMEYLFEEAPRIEGGISHMGTVDLFGDTLWLDSLFMFGMIFTRWGEYLDDRIYLDEIREQILIFAELLQGESGLLMHAYNWPSPQDQDVYWGRGNAWVTASGFEYLRVKRNRGERGDTEVEEVLGRQLQAVLELQDSDTGLWWTVLNLPGETYLETSASALFAYGIARGYRYGFLDGSVLPALSAAMVGVESKILRDASDLPYVTGISGPTTVSDLRGYSRVEVGDDISYGVGAVILALVETSGMGL